MPLTSVSVTALYVFSMWAFSASRSLSVAKGKATSNLPSVSGEDDSKVVVDGATWTWGRRMGEQDAYIDKAWKKSESRIRVMKRCGPINSEPGDTGIGTLRRTT